MGTWFPISSVDLLPRPSWPCMGKPVCKHPEDWGSVFWVNPGDEKLSLLCDLKIKELRSCCFLRLESLQLNVISTPEQLRSSYIYTVLKLFRPLKATARLMWPPVKMKFDTPAGE